MKGKYIGGRRWRKKGVVEVGGLHSRKRSRDPVSRKKKSVEKLATPLWLELNSGKNIHGTGTGMAAGAPVYWKGHAALCRCHN